MSEETVIESLKPQPTREQKSKSLRSRLKQLEESSKGLNNEFWWRSHSAILANRGGKAMIVALTDTDCLRKGHSGWGNDGDPAKEAATTRHVLGTGPSKIATLLAYLYDLYPELADHSDLTVLK